MNSIEKKDNPVLRCLSSVVIVVVNLFFVYSNDMFISGLYVFILGLFMAFEWGSIINSSNKKNILYVVGIFYILLTLIPLLIIKVLPDGNNLLMWLFIIIWSIDTFAYIIGAKMHLNKHKITKISPKKSYEGLFAGMFAAMIIGYIFANKFLPDYKNLLLFFTPLFTVLEQSSDVTESFLKRKFNVKDSGDFIPGHGGFLDRYDGFLYTSLVFLYILLFS